jgi:hypothetical protein
LSKSAGVVMTTSEKTAGSSLILDAIRAKHRRRTSLVGDIADLEASLIADIDSFDLNEAERKARREQLASLHASLANADMAFPEIVPSGTMRDFDHRRVPTGGGEPSRDPQGVIQSSHLLFQLRQQAEIRQRELHVEETERTASNLALDRVLRYMFFYLHDLVQQVNIVKPAIPRVYTAADDVVLDNLVWQEGFADYRTQSQAAGAMVELVTLSYQLSSPRDFFVERKGAGVDRLRSRIFDYGLQFSCKEFKNKLALVERGEFQIRGQVGVSARWRADFGKGALVLESRNLERLGSASVTIRTGAVDQALLDEFGRLVLGLPNQFRELAKR